MDNQIDISKSYFINKSIVKNKVRKRMKRIQEYKKFSDDIINSADEYNDPVHTNQAIRLIDGIVTRYKEKIKKETNIYFY